MFLLSGYVGNNVKIENMNVTIDNEKLIISGALISAFHNDFDELFSTGLRITTVYEIVVSSNKKRLYQKIFTQSVYWDPHYCQWIVLYEESPFESMICDYSEMIHIFSLFKTNIYLDIYEYDNVDVRVSARMQNLYIPSQGKDLDLMLLWKKKIPEGRINVQTKEFR